MDGHNQNKNLKNEIIHSGHFMVSEIDEHEENDKNDNETHFNVKNTGKNLIKTYRMKESNNRVVSIDQSLWKLFQCMTLAYDDEITSPKWKTFKGLKMNIKEKIRLNNIIWRAWHIQYISGRKPVVCQFSSNIDTERHKKSEAILLEGKYWKRRADVIKAEYNKWRLYHQHIFKRKTRNSKIFQYDWENNLPRWSNNLSFDSLFSSKSNINNHIQPLDDNASLTYANYYDYAKSREIARSGMGADFMQPGLEQLQPNIDFIDTFEPIQDFISFKGQLPTLPEEPNEFNSNLIKELHTQDELFDSIFPVDSCQTTSSNETGISPKSMMAQENYVSSPVFTANNTLIQVNSKLNNGNSTHLVQQQTLNETENYEDIPKLNITPQSNNYNYANALSYNNLNQQSTTVQEINSSALNELRRSTILNTNNTNPYKMDYETNNLSIQQPDTTTFENSVSFVPTFQGSKIMEPRPFQMIDNNSFDSVIYYSSNELSQHLLENSNEEVNDQKKLVNSIINKGVKSFSTNGRNAKNQSMKDMPSMSQLNSIHSGEPSQFTTYHVPTNSTHRANIERSLSVPINYGQNQIKKFGLNDSELLQQKLPKENFLSDLNTIQYEMKTKFCESNSFGSQTLLNPSVPFLTPKTMSSSQVSEIPTQILLANNSASNKNPYISNISSSSSSSSSIGSLEVNSRTVSNLLPAAFDLSNLQKKQHLFTSLPNKKSYHSNRNSHDTKKNLKSFHLPLDYSSLKDRLITGKDFSEIQSSSLMANASKTPGIINVENSLKIMQTSPSSSFMYNPLGSMCKNEDRILHKERRRVCHINAEQKRRCNIKNGFDTLRSLLPGLNNNSNMKISKAAMLHRAADHIRNLKNEKFEQQKECEMLKQQVDSLNQIIGVFQNQLPTSGAPIVGSRTNKIKEQYAKYVKQKTIQNWKFWIFSIIMESLLDSYCNTVATSNFDEMCKTLFRWLDQGCSLINLRKDVLNSLRLVSTSTNILTNPEMLSEEILQANIQEKRQGEQNFN